MRPAAALVFCLIGSFLPLADAHASPESRACVAESCRQAGKDCAGAFRDTKRTALTTCEQTSTGKSLRACRRQVRTTVRNGVQSCRRSLRECKKCCRDGGGACHVQVCGNTLLEGGEACDTEALGLCTGTCRNDCTCAPAPVCGNSDAEGREQCDGTDDGACPGSCQIDCTCP
jgi:hypothetical protein